MIMMTFATDDPQSCGTLESRAKAEEEYARRLQLLPKKGDEVSIYTLPLHFRKVLSDSHGVSAEPNNDIPRLANLLKAGNLNLDGLITHEFKLHRIDQAINLVKSGEAGRVFSAIEA